MKLRIFPSILFFLILVYTDYITAQEEVDVKDLYVEAEAFFLFQEYNDALPLYQRILREQPNNYNVTYKIGICYLNNPYQKQKAVNYLEKVINHTSIKYKGTSFKEQMAPIDAHFYLAQAYRKNNQLDKAIERFKYFKEILDPELFDVDLVDDEIKSCEVAKKVQKSPVYKDFVNLGQPVNTRFSEINPVLSGDGKTLIFTRQLQFYDGIFLSRKTDDRNWTEPVNLTPDFGLDGNSYSTGISYDGTEIFAYRSDEYDGNIYTSKLVNGKWSVLVKLNANINTKYWESHASPSPDGQYLYFTSNRKEGYGGLDIYKSKRLADGDWGVPVNLGPIVNSPFNEESPFLSTDGNTLYFSSEGHSTMGGYDIFVSVLKGPQTWSRPQNMGFPINSTDDDIFYQPVKETHHAMYAMYDAATTNGLGDIYLLEVYNDFIPRTFTIEGKINLPQELDEIKKGTVTLINNETGTVVSQTSINIEDGTYNLKTKQGNYNLLIEGENILPVTIPITIAVASDKNVVEVPAVIAQASEEKQPVAKIETKEVPKLDIKEQQYIVNTDNAIPIELTLEKNSLLQVQAIHEGEIIVSEELKPSRRKYIYMYKPIPGENLLTFTVISEDSVINRKEVVIFYELEQEQKEDLAVPFANQVPLGSETAILSFLASRYFNIDLKAPDEGVYSSYYELYKAMLNMDAETGDDSIAIRNLFSIYLSQRDILDFTNDLFSFESLTILKNDTFNFENIVPLQYLEYVRLNYSDETEYLMNLAEVDISGKLSTDIKGSLSYIMSFSNEKDYDIPDNQNTLSAEKKLEFINSNLKSSFGSAALDMSSSTMPLEFFFQKLLLASDGALHAKLLEINFDSLGITNTLELINYLFNESANLQYTEEDIFLTLEKAKALEDTYLQEFHEYLTQNATGNLKNTLMNFNLHKEQIGSFEGLIRALLLESRTNSYSPESVYKLLIDLIGIQDVEEFAAKMLTYAEGNLYNAISNSDLSQFSNPLELVQYLLSIASQYDYSNSDINNLLLRILLEKGLEKRGIDSKSEARKGFFHERKLLNTIVLANIILIIILVLFLRRRRKSK